MNAPRERIVNEKLRRRVPAQGPDGQLRAEIDPHSFCKPLGKKAR